LACKIDFNFDSTRVEMGAKKEKQPGVAENLKRKLAIKAYWRFKPNERSQIPQLSN